MIFVDNSSYDRNKREKKEKKRRIYVFLGETVRKLKIGQSKPQNIETNNMNNNKMMWSEN